MAYKVPRRSMKKTIFVMLAMICSLSCFAQTTKYIGPCSLYMADDYGSYGFTYGAHISFGRENTQANVAYSDKIIRLYDNTQYSSKHGEYIEFQKIEYLAGTNLHMQSQNFLFKWSIGGVNSWFAFVNSKQSGLCVVDIETDEIRSVLIPNFSEGKDFSITLYFNYNQRDYGFYILNNGYLTTYTSFPENASSVKGINADAKTRRTYSLHGVETKSLTTGVYIQDGEKVLYNK